VYNIALNGRGRTTFTGLHAASWLRWRDDVASLTAMHTGRSSATEQSLVPVLLSAASPYNLKETETNTQYQYNAEFRAVEKASEQAVWERGSKLENR